MEKIGNIIGVDHVGYAVKDMGRARAYFASLGYIFTENKADELRSVNVSVGKMRGGGYKVELLSPIDGRKSPVDGYLSKVGSTPYHICYHVDDMDGAVSALLDAGFTQMSCPAPSVPLGGNVCFLYSPEIGIIELIDYRAD